ncbi:polysaccharide deacetylase family protein [Candidatus Microgenomates bacterium]|nr:polysaccharide deacetylase family protein [Candidatus Microgenomates bacterium]
MDTLIAALAALHIITAPLAPIASYTAVHSCEFTANKRIALTFDADMTAGMEKLLETHEVTSWYNRDLIHYLNRHQIPATLFLTGMWAETYPKEARALARNPLFEIANHSYSHPGFAHPCYGLEYVNEAQKRYELYHSKAVLKAITGIDTTLFRFPGGCQAAMDVELVRSMGLTPVGWTIVSGDAFAGDTASIVQNVLSQAHDGGIVVAHMNAGPNAPKTAEAIKELVPILRSEGFIFVKVSELLPIDDLLACRE